MNYDPKKVSLIVDGLYITGYMDGSMIAAAKNEDNVIPHIGAQGDVTFTESADNTGTITVNLKQTSSSLPHFINLARDKKEFAAQVVDANGNKFKAGGNRCRVLKTPDVGWESEVTGVEISVYVADYDLKQ